jgi:hypothetical protein
VVVSETRPGDVFVSKSLDGINNWTNRGLAYDPTTDFIRYTNGTVNHWDKIERPGVLAAR